MMKIFLVFYHTIDNFKLRFAKWLADLRSKDKEAKLSEFNTDPDWKQRQIIFLPRMEKQRSAVVTIYQRSVSLVLVHIHYTHNWEKREESLSFYKNCLKFHNSYRFKKDNTGSQSHFM